MSVAQDVMHGGGQIGMPDTTCGPVERAQRRRPAGVGDKTREPPCPVVGLTNAAAPARPGRRPTATPSVVASPRAAAWLAGRRSRPHLRSATGARPLPCRRARHSEKARGSTRFVMPDSLMPTAPGANTIRWPIAIRRAGSTRSATATAAISAHCAAGPPPASVSNCRCEPVATTAISRGQSVPQNASTASTA